MARKPYKEHPHEVVHIRGDRTDCYDCGKTWDTNDECPPSCGHESADDGDADEPMDTFEVAFWVMLVFWGLYAVYGVVKKVFL